MSRLLAKGIGKRYIPNELEGHETPAIDREDYFYKVGVIYESIHSYKEYNPNPAVPYYKNREPKTEVILANGDELMLIIPFEVFDTFYFKHYTEKTIMIRPQ